MRWRTPIGGASSDTEDGGKAQAPHGELGGAREGLRGESVSGGVEATAHSQPVKIPSGKSQSSKNLLQEALHFRAVEPALSSAVSDDGQVVAGDRGAVSVSRAKLPRSALSLMVVAVIGDSSAASPATRVAKAR